MPSPRLVAFLDELERTFPDHRARAATLLARTPGEGQPALTAAEEARVLLALADRLGPIVQGWVGAVQQLATVERAWGTTERAREAAQRFTRLDAEFLDVWEHLLRVQPATQAMQRVLGLVHLGCSELFASGPEALVASCRAIVAGLSEARLVFEPEAPSLVLATQELQRLRA